MAYIYKIKNKINDKVYVGQTIQPISKRWNEHIYNAYTSETKIARAIRKYGIKNFEISIIEECDVSDLNVKETYWIKYYDSVNTGYNIRWGGEQQSFLDYDAIITEYLLTLDIYQTAKKFNIKIQTIKRILDGAHISYESKPMIDEKPVDMIDINSKQIIKSFNSLTDAANYQEGWNLTTISAAARGRRHAAYGYYWRYKDELNKTFKYTHPHKRKVIQCDKNTGEKIKEYESIAAANREFGKPADHKSIGNVLRGKAKTAFGYKWKKE